MRKRYVASTPSQVVTAKVEDDGLLGVKKFCFIWLYMYLESA
jgi:hypothetical protein